MCVLALLQLEKHLPLISQDRQASVSPNFGKGALVPCCLLSSISFRLLRWAASQRFLIAAFQFMLLARVLPPLAFIEVCSVFMPAAGVSVDFTCSIQLAGSCPRNPSRVLV